MKLIICYRCWCAVMALLPVLLLADMLPVSWSSAEGSSDSDSLASVSVVDISSSSLALSRFDASPPARYLVKLSCCIMYNKMPCLVLRGMFYKKFRSFVCQFQFNSLGYKMDYTEIMFWWLVVLSSQQIGWLLKGLWMMSLSWWYKVIRPVHIIT